MRSNTFTHRRTVLNVTGGSLVTAALAGCLGDDEPAEENGEDTDTGANGIEIASGTGIVFDGYTEHWEGLEPDSLSGEENPTLVLEERRVLDGVDQRR